MRIINADPSYGQAMTAHELRNFLSNSKLNIHLGTIDEKDEPNIHPAHYYFDSLAEKIYIETSKDSRKVINVKRKDIVYFCVDEGSTPYKGVRGKGKARISEDIDWNIPVAEKIITKYNQSLESPSAKGLMDGVRKGRSVILEISPIYYSTWNYGKKT